MRILPLAIAYINNCKTKLRNMKRFVFTLLIASISSLTLTGQDFRKTTWGMSPNEVKESESLELVQETEDALVYETTIAGLNTYLGYIFTDGKLTRTKYYITEIHMNESEYVTDYDYLNGFLKKKYGIPTQEEVAWKDDSPYKARKSDWGNRIEDGDLTLFTIYNTSNTEIKIRLSAEDYKIFLEIQYSSMSEELKKLEEEKILEDF